MFSPNSDVVNRQTYSILDWLGDMGGLLDSLYFLGLLFVNPVSTFALRSHLLSKLFRYSGSADSDESESDGEGLDIIRRDSKSLLKHIKAGKVIPKLTYFRVLFCRDTKYKKL